MNFINFEKITQDGKFKHPEESENLEYKTSGWKLPKSLWETISSFSNTAGGLIVLGIKEDKANHEFTITGVDDPDALLEQIFNNNSNSSCLNRPVVQNSDVRVTSYHNKKLIQIIIHPESFNARPITAFGVAYVRTGDGDRKATPEQKKYFAIESQNEIDTHLLPSSYSIDDLDLESFHAYRRALSDKGIVDVNENISDKELLISLGVFRKDRLSNTNNYLLTDGGLLFFGKYISITDRFPRFQLDYQKYDSDTAVNWVDRVSAGDMNFPSLNIYTFYNLVLSKLMNSVPDKFVQSADMSRTSYYADVTSAAKEALVNTLMHSYYDGTVGVKIVDRPSYFEFTNPGTMRVSKESFLRGQYSSIRNTEIASLFRRIGVSETAASGGPRILNAAIKNDLNDPEISIDYKMNTTKIRIWKVTTTQSDALGNLDKIEAYILSFAKKHNYFDVKDVTDSPQNTFGKATAIRNALNSLSEKKLLLRRKDGRKYVYQLNSGNNYLDQIKHLKHLEDNLLK